MKDEQCPGISVCYTQAPYKNKCTWVQLQSDKGVNTNQCLLPNHCQVHKGFIHCVTHPKIKSENFGRCARVSPVLENAPSQESGPTIQPTPNLGSGPTMQPLFNLESGPTLQPTTDLGSGPTMQPTTDLGSGPTTYIPIPNFAPNAKPIQNIDYGLNAHPISRMNNKPNVQPLPNLQSGPTAKPIQSMDYGLHAYPISRMINRPNVQSFLPNFGSGQIRQPIHTSILLPNVQSIANENNWPNHISRQTVGADYDYGQSDYMVNPLPSICS